MTQITNEQRYTISTMLKKGYNPSDIAKTIDKCPSVVSREIKRNSDNRSKEYRYELAVRKCTQRHKDKNKRRDFTFEIQENVVALLREDYSPEQVVGTLRKEEKATVSIERVYQYIWKDKKSGGNIHEHLPRQGRKYRKRECFGDLEVDLIIGKAHQQAILTINDRASGMLKMQKVNSKESKIVCSAINKLLEEWKPYLPTITSDNGKEFAHHVSVTQELDIGYFFANPYHLWERGSNENLNGLIRQYFTKGSSFLELTDQRISEVELKLNSRPRKRFNYQTLCLL